MPTRTWIAVLLLLNYLLVAGSGCMSYPGDQREFVMVQTSEAGYDYQECRYLRMDGLESFLAESLASRYQNGPTTPKHQHISIIFGVDAHYLTQTTWPLPKATYQEEATLVMNYLLPVPAGVSRVMNAPPWLG